MTPPGTVACFTADTCLRPRTDEAGQAILIALWNVACGVAGAASVRQVYFPSMIGYKLVPRP